MSRSFFLGFIAILPLLLAIASADEPRLVPRDPLKQLVLDSRIIDRTENAVLTLGKVEKEPNNPLFRADRPWENSLNNLYPNVLYDAEAKRFKLWYKCVVHDKDVIAKMDRPTPVHEQGWYLLYAESADGLRWERPGLGLHRFDGGDTNAVTKDTPNVGVFRDDHDPDAARRYKMIYDVGLGKPRVRFSSDGIHWSEPQEPKGYTAYNGDTHSNAFWDDRLGKYVLFTKLYIGERLVARLESDDFLNWKNSGVVLRSDIEEGKKSQTYCLTAFPYGNIYLGYVMMYHVGRDRSVDCELAWSPDSVHWQRVKPGTPIIPRGQPGSGDSMCIYGPAGPPIAQGDNVLIYYGGSDEAHLGWKRHCLPSLARLRLDGFAGYQPGASSEVARLITQPLLVDDDVLRVSADCNGGSLRVRVADDAHGEWSQPITADVTDGEMKWKSQPWLKRKGRFVRLEFELTRAKLYAFRGLRYLPPPNISTDVRRFERELEITLNDAAGGEIHYTLDGSAPTLNSPVYSTPLKLTAVTDLRARIFSKGVAGGSPELKATFERREPSEFVPSKNSVAFSFDSDAEGWQGVDRVEHRPEGFLIARREAGLTPHLFYDASKSERGLVDWPKTFGGEETRIAFKLRNEKPGGGARVEIFAGEMGQWSRELAAESDDLTAFSTRICWDWNDAEAEAAGWRRAANAFSWRETIRHVGRIVVAPSVRDATSSFELDDFTIGK